MPTPSHPTHHTHTTILTSSTALPQAQATDAVPKQSGMSASSSESVVVTIENS